MKLCPVLGIMMPLYKYKMLLNGLERRSVMTKSSYIWKS